MSTCTKNDELLRCSECGEMKPRELFHLCKHFKRGRCYACKACKKAREKQRHNERKKRYSEAEEALEKVFYEKVCKICKRLLPTNMFPKSAKSCDYLHCYCRECSSIASRQRKYGLSKEAIEEMLAVEVCQMPGCGRKLDKGMHTHIDHCHASGKVRAVLCRECNIMLGYIEKRPHLAQSMLDYIAKHKDDDESE